METKKPWQSKTIWVNVIMAIVPVLPGPVHEFLRDNPDVILSAFAIVNVLLRAITHGKVTLQ